MKRLLIVALILAVIPVMGCPDGAIAQDKQPEKSVETQKAEAYLTLSNIQGRILVIQNILDSLQKDKIDLKEVEAKIKAKLTELNKQPDK